MHALHHPWALLTLLTLSACGSASGAPEVTAGSGGVAGSAGGVGDSGAAGVGSTAGGGNPSGQVQLGVPGGPDSLDFTPLAAGAELRLETFGQGGTHVLLGVRCIGFGSRAFVSLRVQNSLTGTEIVAPAPVRPQLLFCEGDACDLVPITMMMGGLTQSDDERNGLPIEITAEVHNQAGISGTASQRAVLSTADL